MVLSHTWCSDIQAEDDGFEGCFILDNMFTVKFHQVKNTD